MGSARIVICGGGTGGHVYPALAIADAARAHGHDVSFVGTQAGLENRVVPAQGYEFHAIDASGLLGKSPRQIVAGIGRAMRGLAQAYALLARLKPGVVVATGGYVTGPVGLAAYLRRTPLVVLEANVVPGFTNRILGRFARRILVPFDQAVSRFPAPQRAKVRATGNPVRREVFAATCEEGRQAFGLTDGVPVLLVVGGSLGGQRLNEAVAQTLALLPPVQVIWATGPRYYERYHHLQRPGLQVHAYLENMPLALAAADIAVTRAGAMTIGELTARGIPAILIPSPNVSEDHQTKNAQLLSMAGAATLLPESQLTPQRLADEIAALATDADRREAMHRASVSLGRPGAVDEILGEIEHILEERP